MVALRELLNKKYKKHNIAHLAGRGFEWALLQSRPTTPIYWRTIPTFYRWKYGRELRKYDHPPQPFRRLYIDPTKITRRSSRSASKGVYDVGGVRGGDWDQDCSSVEEIGVFRAIRQRYESEMDWSEIPFVQKKLEQVQRGRKTWHSCTSKDDIFDRCEILDQLFNTIAQEGYKSQPELRDGAPSLTDAFGFLNEYINEIAVDIGRDGEFLLLDSRHRLAMAHVLDIQKVPVAVIVRHKGWMKHRQRITTKRTEYSHGHPDIVEHTA